MVPPIGVHAILGANVFAAAPRAPWRNDPRSLALQKVEKPSAHQAAQPRGAQPHERQDKAVIH